MRHRKTQTSRVGRTITWRGLVRPGGLVLAGLLFAGCMGTTTGATNITKQSNRRSPSAKSRPPATYRKVAG
jgi:hypothetical protein